MKVVTIGRSPDNNNVVINDSRVSRSHLQIVEDDTGNYYVIDLGSTNGTFVNGKRISGKTLLQKGDTIVIGNTTLAWEKYYVGESGDGSDPDPMPEKPNRKRMYIIIASALLICMVIGILYVISYNKEQNKKEQKYNEAKEQTQDAILNYSNEKRKEAEDAAKQADADRIKAEEAEKLAKEAKKKADNKAKTATEAKESAERKLKTAEEAERLAKEAKKQAEDAKKIAEEEAAEAMKAAEKYADSVNMARKELNDVQETLNLTKEFYVLLPQVTGQKLKKVCDKVGLKKEQSEGALKNAFDKINTEGKRKMIKAIKEVLNDTSADKQQQSAKPMTETNVQDSIRK